LLDSNRDYAQVLEEYNSSGIQVSYVYGHDLISQNRNGTKSFYLYDGLGTTKALTDSSGVVTDRYIYDTYGNILSSSGTTLNSYLYTGEQFDKNLGQYYLRDRYYSQGVGRFTRSDKFEGKLTQPLSLNQYLYTNSNPINWNDPSGFFSSELSATLIISGILAQVIYPFPTSLGIYTGKSKSSIEVRFRPALGVIGVNGTLNHAYIYLKDTIQNIDYIYSAFPSNGGGGIFAYGFIHSHGYIKPESWKSPQVSPELSFQTVLKESIDSQNLPAWYWKIKLDATKTWLEQERFRYLGWTQNSNSAASQWMQDLAGYRLNIDETFAPGWNNYLREYQNYSDRNWSL
jgi:RHS repeat-associated protein